MTFLLPVAATDEKKRSNAKTGNGAQQPAQVVAINADIAARDPSAPPPKRWGAPAKPFVKPQPHEILN